MIKITISDGAGEGSAILAMFSMMQNIKIDKENESGYERTQTFDGQPTLVKYQSAENHEKLKNHFNRMPFCFYGKCTNSAYR